MNIKLMERYGDVTLWHMRSVLGRVPQTRVSVLPCRQRFLSTNLGSGLPGEKDPSRGIILDLQEKCDWKMPATVMMHTNELALSLDDSLQVQCLPVYRTDRPKWTYRKVPKVTRFQEL